MKQKEKHDKQQQYEYLHDKKKTRKNKWNETVSLYKWKFQWIILTFIYKKKKKKNNAKKWKNLKMKKISKNMTFNKVLREFLNYLNIHNITNTKANTHTYTYTIRTYTQTHLVVHIYTYCMCS